MLLKPFSMMRAAAAPSGGVSRIGGGVAARTDATDITLPGGLAENDIIIFFRASDNALSGDATTDYTNIVNDGTVDLPGYILEYKFMGSTPDTVIPVIGAGTDRNAQACIYEIWRGVNTSTPFDVTVPTVTTEATSATISPPAITPVTNGCAILVFGAVDDLVGSMGGFPSGYTNTQEINSTAISNQTALAACGSKIQTTAGLETPGTFTWPASGDPSVGITIALKPA